MASEPIRSVRNPLIQALRKLHRASARQEQARILLEGTHLFNETLRLAQRPELVLATSEWLERHALQVGRLAPSVRVQPATPEVVAAVSTTRHPDGVVLTLPLSSLPSPREVAQEPQFVLALDRVQDPGNLGTLLRTALAAGVDQVWLGEGADPLQPKVVRASSGSILALPLLRLRAPGLVAELRRGLQRGLQVVAAVPPDLDAAPGAMPYWKLDWTRPTALLLGNEGAGLAPELMALADRRVTIPHSPAVESLNVAVAATPLLLERWRQAHDGPAA